MGLREFFKPTKGKIIISVLLLILTFFYITSVPGITINKYTGHGLPFYYIVEIIPLTSLGETNFSFEYTSLVFDIVFWYILSCLVIYLYNKNVLKRNKK